jgi:hypothetical protein
MYSHSIGIDDELWDIIEKEVNFEVDEEGVVADIRSLLPSRRRCTRSTTKYVEY